MTKEEALEIIKANCSCSSSALREACGMFIPELREDEDDEKIREELIRMVKWSSKSGGDKYIAWLNKNHTDNTKQSEKEKTDYVSNRFLYCKSSFNDFEEGKSYWLEYVGDDVYEGRSDNVLNKRFHITPKELYTCFDWGRPWLSPGFPEKKETPEIEMVLALRGEYERGRASAFAEMRTTGKVESFADFCGTPFEKQVADVIASVINKEYGYSLGYVQYVAQTLFHFAKNEITSEGWSEEDENNLVGILSCYKSMEIKWRHWLKSLKSRVQSQKLNDSEERGQEGVCSSSPKFSVGDKIRSKNGVYQDEVLSVNPDGSYKLKRLGGLFLPEDEWELENGHESIEDEEKHANFKTAEWSDEDEQMLSGFLHKLEVCDLLTNKEDVWITRKLKSLRPQPQQKWGEQDEACWNLIWDILDGRFTASKKGFKTAAKWFAENCPKGFKGGREWSEEDKKMLEDIIMCGEKHLYLDAGNIDWLKSLRLQPPTKWISDDMLRALIKSLSTCGWSHIGPFPKELVIERLRTSGVLYSWKPNKEQMEALRVAGEVGTSNESWAMGKLKTLYAELQKLF